MVFRIILYSIGALLFLACEKSENTEKERFPLVFKIVNNSDSVIGPYIDARIYYPEEDVTWFVWRNCSDLASGDTCIEIADADSAYIGCEYQYFASIFKYIPDQHLYLKWSFYNGLDTIKKLSRTRIYFRMA